jgi:hypothetical protein
MFNRVLLDDQAAVVAMPEKAPVIRAASFKSFIRFLAGNQMAIRNLLKAWQLHNRACFLFSEC